MSPLRTRPPPHLSIPSPGTPIANVLAEAFPSSQYGFVALYNEGSEGRLEESDFHSNLLQPRLLGVVYVPNGRLVFYVSWLDVCGSGVRRPYQRFGEQGS